MSAACSFSFFFTLPFQACLRCNLIYIQVFVRICIIKTALIPFRHLFWLLVIRVCPWQETYFWEFIWDTLVHVKSVKNKQSLHMWARPLKHICKRKPLELIIIFLTYTWVMLVIFWQDSLRISFSFFSNMSIKPILQISVSRFWLCLTFIYSFWSSFSASFSFSVSFCFFSSFCFTFSF